MTMTTCFKAAAFSALVLCASQQAFAAIVVDQSNVAVAPGGGQLLGLPIGEPLLFDNMLYKQTGIQFVTAGKTGSLAAIDLHLSKNPAFPDVNFDVQILRNLTFTGPGFTSANVALADVIGQFSFNSSAVSAAGGLLNIDTSAAGIYLYEGDQFALMLRNAPGNFSFVNWIVGSSTDAPGVPFNPATFTPNAYTGGSGFLSRSQAFVSVPQSFGNIGTTYGFQTYVDFEGSAVPEPATWAMLILGFGMVGAASRRRRGGLKQVQG